MMERNTSASAVVLALVSGAVLGAGLALLFAPQAGRRTRRALRELGEEAGEYAQGLFEKAESGVRRAAKKGEAWAQKGKDLADEAKRQVSSAGEGAY